jgi:geranylgeranyl pyrophosphate synthase
LSVRKEFSKRLAEKKDKLKTASYSFIRPLQIGASLVGIDDGIERLCDKLGLNLGLAYQMQDDLLDGIVDEGQLAELKAGIETYLDNATRMIKEFEIEEKYKQEFYEFIETLRNRKS